MQDYVEQGLVDMDAPVVGDVAKFSESVHEETYARPGRSYHVCESLLCDGRDHAFRFSGFAKFSHDQQCTREAFLAVIEELIDQIFLSPHSPQEQKFQKNIGEFMLFMEKEQHIPAVELQRFAGRNRGGRSDVYFR